MKYLLHILIFFVCILCTIGCVSNGANNGGPQVTPVVDAVDNVDGDKLVTNETNRVARFKLNQKQGYKYAVRTKVTVNYNLNHAQTGESSKASKIAETVVYFKDKDRKQLAKAIVEGRAHSFNFAQAQANQEAVKDLKGKILAYLQQEKKSQEKAKKSINEGQIGQVQSYREWRARNQRQVADAGKNTVRQEKTKPQDNTLAVVETGNSTQVASSANLVPVDNAGGGNVAKPTAELQGKLDGRLITEHSFENKAIDAPNTDPNVASGSLLYGARAGFDMVKNEEGISYQTYEAVEVGSRLSFFNDRVSFFSLFQAEHGLDWMKNKSMSVALKGQAGVEAWLTNFLAIAAYTSVHGRDVITDPTDIDAFTGGRLTAVAGGFTFSVTGEVQVFGIEGDAVTLLDTLKTGFLGTYEDESLKFSLKMTQFHIAAVNPAYRGLSKFEIFGEKTFNPGWALMNKFIVSAEAKGNLNPEVDFAQFNTYSETRPIESWGNLTFFSGAELKFENGGKVFWGGLYGFKGQVKGFDYKVAADSTTNLHDWMDNTTGFEVALGNRKTSAFFALIRAEVEDFDFSVVSLKAETSVFIVDGTELFAESNMANIFEPGNFSAFGGIRHQLGNHGYVGVQGGYDPDTDTVAKVVFNFGGETNIY